MAACIVGFQRRKSKLGSLCGPAEVARLTAVVEDSRRDLAVRVDASRVLGAAGDTPKSVHALTRLLNEVSNKHGPVYSALFAVCRRTGMSIHPDAVGLPPVRYLA